MQEFYTTYDNYFPIRHKKISEKRAKNGWLTKALLTSIREKHRLLKSAGMGLSTRQTYLAYSTLLKKLIRKSKALCFEDKFKQSQAEPRSTWGTINGILNRNKSKSSCIDKLR